MRRINRYVGFTVFMSIAATLLGLVGIDVLSSFIDERNDIEGGYTLREVTRYVVWSIPSKIYEFLAYACFIGCVLGLGIHAGANELVIMRAAGVSIGKIAWATLRPILVVIGLGFALGEYVIPLTDQVAQSGKAMALGDRQNSELGGGLWSREGREYMHFNAVLPNGKLFGVTRFQFDDDNKLLVSSFAEQAIYQDGFWQEEKVRESRVEDGRIVVKTYPTRIWKTELAPSLLNILVLPADALSIRNLYDYATYLTEQGLVASEYWLAFWKKVLQPLVIIGLVLVGMSFIFGSLREATMSFRIVLALMVSLVFYFGQELLGAASLVYGTSPLVAVLVPALLSVALGMWMLRRR